MLIQHVNAYGRSQIGHAYQAVRTHARSMATLFWKRFSPSLVLTYALMLVDEHDDLPAQADACSDNGQRFFVRRPCSWPKLATRCFLVLGRMVSRIWINKLHPTRTSVCEESWSIRSDDLQFREARAAKHRRYYETSFFAFFPGLLECSQQK